jgi:hypothetical protein
MAIVVASAAFGWVVVVRTRLYLPLKICTFRNSSPCISNRSNKDIYIYIYIYIHTYTIDPILDRIALHNRMEK